MGLVFKNLNKDNIKITPYTAHKQWNFVDSASATAIGIKWYEGKFLPGFFSPADPDQGDASTEEKTTGGQYKKLVHASIDHLYYFGKDSPYETFCNTNPIEQVRELHDRVHVMSIPQQIYGDAIKPGSLSLTFSASVGGMFTGSGGNPRVLKDDGYGNLYDSTDTRAYINETASSVYVGYWENFRYAAGYTSSLEATKSIYWPHIETRVDGNVRAWADSYNMAAINDSDQPTVFYSWVGAGARYSGLSGEKTKGINFRDSVGVENIWYTGSATGPTSSLSEAPATASYNDMSYTVLRRTGNMEFNDDFAIAFTFRCDVTASMTSSAWSYAGAPTSSGHRTAKYRPYGTIVTKEEWFGGHCPFSIYIDYSETKIKFKRRSKAGGETIISAGFNNKGWTRVICQKSGDAIQIFTNAGTAASALDKAHGLVTTTKTPIHIGARRYGKRVRVNPTELDKNLRTKGKKWQYDNHIDPFAGYLDEVHIYDRAFSTAERLTYMGSGLLVSSRAPNNNRVGNVMYEHGLVTITRPYADGVDGQYYHEATGSFTDISFKGSHDLTEHIYICNVLDGEYNLTENITVREEFNPRNDKMQSYTTGSEWSPYITTVGLYDSQNNLCAVGKLAQAVKNPSDYDLSFMVRFDTNPNS